MNNAINITQAARQIGCSTVWLREAARKGKIPNAKRDINGWRVYTTEDIYHIKALLRGQSLEEYTQDVRTDPAITTLSEIMSRLDYLEARLDEIESRRNES